MIELLDQVIVDTPTTELAWYRAVRPRSRMKTRAPTQYDRGRTCTQQECRAILSVYNKAEVCFAHQPRKVPRIRGRFYVRG